MKIVIDSGIPFIRGIFESVATVVYIPGIKITKTEIIDADALIIRTRTHCDRKLLHDTNIKVICSATIGYDHINTKYCESMGIKWHTVPGCNANSVAQYFLASLSVLSNVEKFSFDKITVGVIGYGNVGKLIVNYCKTLGIRTLVNDPPLSEIDSSIIYTPLNEVIEGSNILTFHTPLTLEGKYSTYQFVDYKLLCKAQPKTSVINTSRGEIINEEDLIRLKFSGIIGHTIMDVWMNEPDINQNLLYSNLLSTSHIAGYSADGKFNGTLGCVRHICNEFALPPLENNMVFPPTPLNSNLIADCLDKRFEDIFSEVILQTYNILEDSKLLKNNYLSFEAIRNNYPTRREFGSYLLSLKNSSIETRQKFGLLGFNLV